MTNENTPELLKKAINCWESLREPMMEFEIVDPKGMIPHLVIDAFFSGYRDGAMAGHEHKIQVTRIYGARGADVFAEGDTSKYISMPRKKWDGEAPLYSEKYDEYLYSEDAVNYLAEEHDCSIESLRLIICEPTRFSTLDASFFYDDLPEDGELPAELEAAIDAFNSVIETLPPGSWSPGKYAADL